MTRRRPPLRILPFAVCLVASTAPATATPLGAAGPQDPIPHDVRASADRGLDYLLRAQHRDGSWGNDAGAPSDVGNTSIAALALLATGSTPTRGPHADEMRRAMDWLGKRTRGYEEQPIAFGTGTLLQAKLGPSVDLYLVSLLYGQLLGMAIDEHEDARLQRELAAMCRDIASRQKPNGEWETSYEPMLTTVSAWLSLHQAHAGGIPIVHASPQKVVEYLERDCLERSTGIFREARWGKNERFVTQGAALRVFYGSGLERSEEIRRATDVVVRMRFDQDVGGRQGGEEFLGALYATQALFLAKGEAWEAWYPKICKALLACQNRDGSWTGHHCITGKVFCTATAVVTMRTPDRYLPMGER